MRIGTTKIIIISYWNLLLLTICVTFKSNSKKGYIFFMSLLNYVPFVLTCLRCLQALHVYVPLNSTCLRDFVPMCQGALRACASKLYVPTCLRALIPWITYLRASKLYVSTCLRALIPWVTCLRALCFYVPTCLNDLNYVPMCPRLLNADVP